MWLTSWWVPDYWISMDFLIQTAWYSIELHARTIQKTLKQHCFSDLLALQRALQKGCTNAVFRLLQQCIFSEALQRTVVQKKRNADFNNTIIMRHGKGVDKRPYSSGVKTTRKTKCNWYFISIHAYTLQKQVTYKKSSTVSLCKYSAITVTHLNVRTSINMPTLKFIFF